MPIYPYKCKECGHSFEVVRKFSDDGKERCPNCKTELNKEDRTVANTSFKLDGSGWYKDSYESKSNKYAFQD